MKTADNQERHGGGVITAQTTSEDGRKQPSINEKTAAAQ